MVSEPPEEAGERCPGAGLAELGLEAEGVTGGGARIIVLRQAKPCPERYPRRNPHKRLLF